MKKIQKVLVTGGAGFIGSNLALSLQERGFTVTVIDDFSNGTPSNLAGFQGDVVDKDILYVDEKHLKGIDAVFHQAAITDTAIQNKELITAVNVAGFGHLLDLATVYYVPFIYASSASVYGDMPAPFKEEMAGNPLNLYGQSKWKADCIAKEAMKTIKSPIIGLRYFNVFGPGEAHKGKMASMIWQLAEQMISGQRPRIFKWGEQKRDQVYIRDVVLANLLALSTQASGIVNIGSGRATSFTEIIQALNEVLCLDLQPEYIDNPYSQVYQNHTEADLTLAKSLLKYKPVWTFNSAVKDYISSIRMKDGLLQGMRY